MQSFQPEHTIRYFRGTLLLGSCSRFQEQIGPDPQIRPAPTVTTIRFGKLEFSGKTGAYSEYQTTKPGTYTISVLSKAGSFIPTNYSYAVAKNKKYTIAIQNPNKDSILKIVFLIAIEE